MSLTSASTPTYRAGWSLASGAAVVRHHRHQHQQTRGFRFGRTWSSYLDPEYAQDICERQRKIRYKYFQTLNRRLSWEQHPLAEDAKSTIKRMSKNYWYSVEQENAARRQLDEEIAASTIDNPTGIRPGQNIEDVERAPLEDLLFGAAKEQTKTKAEAILDKSKRSRGNKRKSRSIEADSEYVIDPITNRKILKAATSGLDDKAPPSGPYTSQFSNLSPPDLDASKPIFYDGPPPEAELKLYSQVDVDDAPWNPINPTSATTLSDVLVKDTPAPDLLNALSSNNAQVSWHTNTGIAATTAVPSMGSKPKPVVLGASETVNEQEATSGELNKYGPVRASEPDGKYKSNTEPVAIKSELGQYNAVRSHEPDGKYNDAAEAPADQTELGKYGAVRSHEPDGKYKQASEENVNKAELGQYGAVRSHEPDGKYKDVVAEEKYDPAELAGYGAVRAHEPDGKYKEQKEFTNTQEYDPAELAEYGSVRAHEPDGMYKKEKAVNNYDEYGPEELAQYKAVRAHEPDGMYKEQKGLTNTQEYDPAELAQYEEPIRAHEPDGMYKKEKEFANYSEYDPAELSSYGAFRAHEPDGMYKKEKSFTNTSEYEDLDSYDKPFLSHEPDGKYAAQMARAESPISEPSVLKELRNRQQPASVAELEAAWSAHCEKNAVDEAKLSEELSQYGAFRSHEPDGKYAAAAQGPTPAYETASEENPLEAFTYEDAQTTKSSAASESQPAEPTTATTTVTQTSGPTVYKILAFNPDTQSVEAAETTSSIIPSNSNNTSNSPADVLPRLTNISKFLPHFARLESEGFEIAAGSGDVLVFRKVREAVPEPAVAHASGKQAVTADGSTMASSGSINPIDMTGGGKKDYHVAAGRFASPTGFVNYNLPSAAGAANQAKVHYEEASATAETQQKEQQQTQETGQKQRRKASIPKRAVMGAAWIAGGAYSVGVVREYFKTGGVDGKGPKGI
ncbi:hypothetical protein QBC32DRAFT_330598 [Pseudoneurospora amorphoporcata]|uniref:Uncharacterized protein n=1 Tax=Pseudoneurospora amorphoporcata TaxID=241081 RepID=A0AAN6P2R5_9PEZI|nr:hypothetical protein QBC32DRAFT_330598 [Pseudoneurospora amorphoporcata]